MAIERNRDVTIDNKSGVSSGQVQDMDTQELLFRVIQELQKMNIKLAIMSDHEIENTEVE